MRRILLASTNTGKILEMKSLLTDLNVHLMTPLDLNLKIDVEETGKTYAQNAVRKAQAYAGASGLITLSDDSGLEVDVLGGEPGIRSARYSPKPNATDADRRGYLLKRLQGHPRPWVAQFCCKVALATPSGEHYLSEGKCSGEIIPQERGCNGFGYDPIFLIPDIGRTMAELTMDEKNRLSHRARAVTAARPTLLRLVNN